MSAIHFGTGGHGGSHGGHQFHMYTPTMKTPIVMTDEARAGWDALAKTPHVPAHEPSVPNPVSDADWSKFKREVARRQATRAMIEDAQGTLPQTGESVASNDVQ